LVTIVNGLLSAIGCNQPTNPSKRNPTANATSSIMANVATLGTRSDGVLPINTADLDIGSERRRSTNPFPNYVAALAIGPNLAIEIDAVTGALTTY
jgi:hypothetical protein